jgi:hypothetical protein
MNQYQTAVGQWFTGAVMLTAFVICACLVAATYCAPQPPDLPLEVYANPDAGLVCVRSYPPAPGVACVALPIADEEELELQRFASDTLVPIAWLRGAQAQRDTARREAARWFRLYNQELTRAP